MALLSDDQSIPREFKLQWIRGLPLLSWFNKEYTEEIYDFEPEDDDLFIATYPKTGTNWMQYIVLQILSKGESFPSFIDAHEIACPFLELTGVGVLKTLKAKPRVYKHHLPYNMVKKNPKSKVIYVYRRPEDTYVSYFHFMRNLNISVEFDPYFEAFLNGKISYGNYFDHILSFLEYKDNGNMLLVSYEKLQLHPKEEYLRIANFIGKDYYDALKQDEAILDKIIERTSFDYMKKNLVETTPSNSDEIFEKKDGKAKHKLNAAKFFRKGVVGDGKKSLSESQLSRLMDLAKDKLKGTQILEEWLQEETSC